MASKVYVFHKTVRGQAHTQKGIPCEDASGSFSVADGKQRYYIAAVADGHGASACFRSGTGAQIAVDAAIDSLKQCAETWLANIKKLPSPDLEKTLSQSGGGTAPASLFRPSEPSGERRRKIMISILWKF